MQQQQQQQQQQQGHYFKQVAFQWPMELHDTFLFHVVQMHVSH
jgi:hypothetical protein